MKRPFARCLSFRVTRSAASLALLASLSSPAPAMTLAITPPTIWISSAPTLGNANRLVVQGRNAYVATEYYGMEIFNVGAPSNPIALGKVATPGGSYDIDISGNYVYLADNYSGVQIIDVTSANFPALVGNIPSSAMNNGPAFGVEVDGGRLYTFSGLDGMRIWDIAANPTNPPLLGTYAPFGTLYSNDGVANGNVVYVADGVHGTMVFDVTNPATPIFVSQPATGVAFDVARIGNLVVAIAAPANYIRTHDVTPPVPNPLPVLDSENMTGICTDVDAAIELSGLSFAYAATTQGVRIWSLNPATAITLQETIAASTGARGVTYYRTYLFVCEGPAGFEIWQR